MLAEEFETPGGGTAVPADTTDEAPPMEGTPGTARRHRRRARLLIGAGVVALLGVATAGALGLGGGNAATSGPTVVRSAGTAQIVRTTLVDAVTVDGKLDHGTPVPVGLPGAAGTVTWLPPVGSTVHRGEPLLRVDDRPVVLLYGDLPMYRRLALPAAPAPAGGGADATAAPSPSAATAPERGHDVTQFETNLRELGYTGFTVDDTYSAQTAQAVRRWQANLGVPQTGAVELADVVYLPGPVRIAGWQVRVGAQASGGDLLTYTGGDRVVSVNVPVDSTAWAAAGTSVDVLLPGDRTVTGLVSGVGTSATAPASGNGADTQGGQGATVPVTITIADQAALGSLDSSPVSVRYVLARRENVLAAPVMALVALAEGGYGVEVVDASGSHFVAVQTGLFADGQVEISGPGVRAGLTVRVPS